MKDGNLFAVYPASIGSTERPTPSGTHKVTTVAMNPTYTYKPEYKFAGVTSDKPFTIKPSAVIAARDHAAHERGG